MYTVYDKHNRIVFKSVIWLEVKNYIEKQYNNIFKVYRDGMTIGLYLR